jgi:hypothetical protein
MFVCSFIDYGTTLIVERILGSESIIRSVLEHMSQQMMSDIYFMVFNFIILPHLFLIAHIYQRVESYFFSVDKRFSVNIFPGVNCLL